MRHAVELKDPTLVFRATHFVAFPTNSDATAPWRSEPPHEHDFRVEARIEASLDKADCVCDFVAAEETLRAVLERWNNKTILASVSPAATYREANDVVEIRLQDRENDEPFVAPKDAVIWLAAANASTEVIAGKILAEWIVLLKKRGAVARREDAVAQIKIEEAPNCYAEASEKFR